MGAVDLAAILFGGLIGATIFGFVRPDREDNKRALLSIAAGIAISLVTAPAICHYSKFHDWEYEAAVAFVIGLVGMTCCKILVAAIQTTKTEGLIPWLLLVAKKFLGIKG